MPRRKSRWTTAETAEHLRTFAEKIRDLFQSIPSPDGDEYTYAEVAAGINARGSVKTSSTALCNLGNGTQDNPRIQLAQAIADFFGIPVTYFLDGDESTAPLYTRLATLPVYESPTMQRTALLLADLSPNAREAVAAIVESARQAEGFDGKRGTFPATN